MRAKLALLSVLTLTACGTLPHDGPSSHAVPRDVAHRTASYGMVNIDYAVTQTIAAHPAAALAGLAGKSSAAPNDVIAEGDGLSISVFEAGSGGLFSRSASSGSASVTGLEPTLTGDSQQTLPRLVVDADGQVAIPFGGSVHVAGLRPREAADAIRMALRRRAINPQVTVTVVDSRANSVAVLGEVRNAGHFPISAHNDRLLDVIASAGGPTKPPADVMVVVDRGDTQAQVALSDLLNRPDQNIRLAPHDQIRLVSRPRRYATFGAFLHNTETPIEEENLTLAGAMSRAGGLDTNSANAAYVMVFRFERPDIAAALGVHLPPAAKGVPIVYRLNLRKSDGFFLADNFDIRADDMLYVPRSDISEAQKFFDLVDTVTQVSYNVRVTGTVP